MRLPASKCATTFAYHLLDAIELTWSRIDVRTRLRRAILTNDLPLTRRILRNNPSHLQSPDFSDKSNTSLHLAAQHGFLAIVEHLVNLGHDRTVPEDPLEILQRKRSASSHSNASSQLSQESEQDNYKELWEEDHYLDSSTLGISHNTDGATPLHLAAAHSHTPVVTFLLQNFPQCLNRPTHSGATALMLAAQAHAESSLSNPSISSPTNPIIKSTQVQVTAGSSATEDTSTIEALLSFAADPNARDKDGNTCLHYASAWGNLKAIRVLVSAGADVGVRNWSGWGAEGYSVTVQAEVYFRNLVAEWEKRRVDEMRAKELQGGELASSGNMRPPPRRMPGSIPGSIRLVTQEDGVGVGEERNSREEGQGYTLCHMSPIGQGDTWR